MSAREIPKAEQDKSQERPLSRGLGLTAPGPSRRASANRGFGWIVGVSVAAHVLAIGSALYAQSVKPAPPPFQTAIPVQLVALGKKRDPKLLPRKVAEAPPPPAEAGVALETKRDPAEKPRAPKDKRPPAEMSDRARKLLESGSASSKLDEALSKLDEREGDPDGDPRGTTTDASSAATGYTRAVMAAIQSAYSLPETIPASQRQFLNAQVLIFVERDGTIARFEFVERHPNNIFMSALETTLRSVRLPPPPAALAQSFRDAGVLVRFRP